MEEIKLDQKSVTQLADEGRIDIKEVEKAFEFLKNTGISTDEIIDNGILIFEKLKEAERNPISFS